MNNIHVQDKVRHVRSGVTKDFFRFLENAGVEYCVVGDTKGLPDEIRGDLDIVVLNVFPSVPRLMDKFCRRYNLNLVQVRQYEPAAWRFDLSWLDDRGQLCFLPADFCGDYMLNDGWLLLRAREILAQRIPAIDEHGNRRDFYRASPPVEFIYYLLKKVHKQELTDRHGDHLHAEWCKDPSNARAQIDRFWAGADAALLAHAAAENEWSSVRSALPRLRQTLFGNLPFGRRKRWKELVRRVQRVRYRTGVHVAFIGTDGSGKSTAIERIEQDLRPAFTRTRQFHLRPRFGGQMQGSVPVTEPHAERARGMVTSPAKIGLWWAYYTLGYALVVYPRLVRSTLVLFDRYYHDLLVDPLRYRYGGPMWLARWVGKLIPKPDLWILLDAPAEVLQSRKQEVPANETARQREAYLRLVQGMNNSVVVDASQPLDDVVREVNMRILDLMAARTARRLGLPDRDARDVR